VEVQFGKVNDDSERTCGTRRRRAAVVSMYVGKCMMGTYSE